MNAPWNVLAFLFFTHFILIPARRVVAPKENKRKVTTPRTESAKRLAVFEGFASAFKDYTTKHAALPQQQLQPQVPNGKTARWVACLGDKIDDLDAEVCV